MTNTYYRKKIDENRMLSPSISELRHLLHCAFVYVLVYDFLRSECSFERHRRVRQMLKYFHNKMDFVDAHLECYETTV